MGDPKLEDVFKISGVPTFTFVEPVEYNRILVSLRSSGRGMVIEGPSGIGKTCAVMKALNQLGKFDEARKLSARKRPDIDIINDIINEKLKGLIIIDDFHRLPIEIKNKIADYLKTLADEEVKDTKIVVVGINRAGDTLIKFAKDLVNRIDIVRFETNPPEKLLELVKKGESALNINIDSKNEIAQESHGSFYLAQMLAHETCLKAGILERNDSTRDTYISIEVVKQSVYERLSLSFSDIVKTFIIGPKLRREGRAPYLHILRWLADSDAWSISLKEEVRKHPEASGSVGQVVEKGYLKKFVEAHPEFQDVLNYDDSTNILTVEDPQFIFFIRNIIWYKLVQQLGFKNLNFESKYDFALSFAGNERDLAQKIFNGLNDQEFSVFYDTNEQHRILAENIEDYLAPIYRSEAKYVICLLSSSYPSRIWTKFESDQFKERFGEHSVIPIRFQDALPGMLDEAAKVCGISFDSSKEMDSQVEAIVQLLTKKLGE
jgi:hypothetical protein